MKKQILILTFFIAAMVAGIISYGQEVDHLDVAPTFCTPAVPLSCGAGDALQPSPGVSYDYTITVSGSPSEVHWFVTDDPSVVTAAGTLTTSIDPGDGSGAYLLTSSSAYNNTSNTDVTIPLTWKSFDGTANQVLLVAYAVNAAGCTDNIEVYRIIPKYSFTLDIAGLLDDGTSGAEECVGPVQTATYDGTNLNVQYGENYVFYTVNAANWQTSWMPTFSATSSDANSGVGTPQWAYPSDATTGGAWHDSGVDEVQASQYASNNNGFIGSSGECIIIRVPVDHTSTESIADETINLVVNGEMINPQTTAYDGAYPDLDEGGAGVDCISDQTTDNADYVITARPDINESDPTPFENKVPRN